MQLLGSEILDYAKSMQPSSLDAELRMMQSSGEEDGDHVAEAVEVVGILLDFLCKAMALNRDFELVQVLTQLVLKVALVVPFRFFSQNLFIFLPTADSRGAHYE